MDERQRLEQAIAVLEAQRAVLGDQVVETALAPLRRQLAALQRSAAPVMEGERRQVTVMFADLSGFTALAERMDPEQVRDLVNTCFECLLPVITAYGGTVETFIGDEVMALFGAPVAHENDPERAIRAALGMMVALEGFNTSHHTDLGIHIGINTGLVIAGDIGVPSQRQYSVMGDAVNLASRLADLATRGQILVGHDTYRLTASLFEFEAREAVHVQGRSEAVAVYRVLRARGPGEVARSPAGLCALLVGRDTECAMLTRCLERLQAGEGQVVAVMGEPGIGKSRLMAEMRRMPLAQDVSWIEGRALSYGGSLAYMPFQEVLRAALGAVQEDNPQALRERLRERLRALFPHRFAEVYPYLGRLLTVPLEAEFETMLSYLDAESLKWQTMRVMGDLLTRLAQERPLVLVLEDLHWADPSSVDLLEYLLPLTESVPLMLVFVFRPQEEASCWRVQRKAVQELAHRYTEIRLRALSPDESEQLMEQLLAARDLPEALSRLVLDRAEGNPLFVEEIVRSLVESGAIVREDGRWRLKAPVDEIAVPDTLQGVLMARIDRLAEDTRRVLQLAAVIGRIFPARLLAAISDMDKDLERHLDTLQRLELIRERSRTPEIEYIFKHALIQETAYHSLLLQRRREIHRRIGECIEELFAGRLEEHYGLLAHHYSMAEEHERALHYLLAAGDQARLAYALEEALDFYRRAMARQRIIGDEEGLARTLLKQGLVYQLRFDCEQARSSFEESFALWQRIEAGHSPRPAQVLYPLRTLLGSDPRTLDPALAAESVSISVLHQLFEGLVQFDAELNAMPAVARSWDILDGGARYIFHLRPDACWSDGSPLTAHDFVYAWRRNLDPATGSDYAILLYDVCGARARHQGQENDPERLGVHALDDHTLEVQLEEPRSSFLSVLASPLAYPLPRAAFQAYGKDWATVEHFLCNGPFRPSEWSPGCFLKLVRNPYYHGHFPGNVEEIHFTILGETAAGLELYRSDQLDVGCVSNPMLDIRHSSEIDLGQIRSSYPHQLHSRVFLDTYYLGFIIDGPPFDDARVRRALAHALDRKRLVERAGGTVLPAWGGFVPPGIAGHSPAIGLRYDPELARRLLAEAGYPGGRGFPPLVLLTATAIGQSQEDLCAQWYETLGVSIRIELVDLGTFVERMAHDPPRLYTVGWLADYPDADSFLRIAYGVGMVGRGWTEARYLELINQVPRLTDRREHMEAYRQADRILVEEAVIVPLWYDQIHLLVKPWVRGLRLSPLGLVRYKEVTLDPH